MKFHITHLICFLKGHDWKYVYRRCLTRRSWVFFTVIDHSYCGRCRLYPTDSNELSYITLPEIIGSFAVRLRSYIHKNSDSDIPF